MENPTTQRVHYAIKPDAQPFDEIRITTVPRFKDSHLSGSEWRTSMQFDFYRNGKVVHTASCGGDIYTAAGLTYHRLVEAVDNGNGYFAGDGIHCDQEGCNEIATITYKLKQGYDRHHKDNLYTGAIRRFCQKHKKRGDQDIGDSDDNYEEVI